MRMKILCLVIPSLQAGGMERVMSELAGCFAEKNEIEIHLVLYGISREIFYSIPDCIIIHKPTFIFNNRYRFLCTLKTLYFVRKEIRGINPDCILSFGEYWNSFVLLSIIGLRYPVFISDRSQPDKSLGWFHDKLRHWLYPKAKGLIFQTEKAKEIFLSKTKHQNIAVIGNPIRCIRSDNSISREKIVLMVGRLIESKHQDILIEMFSQIDQPDWQLIIVGYDHLKQYNMARLQVLAKELGIDNRVIFTGKLNNIEELYLRSSIFAFTSSSEGFPNVIGEAMSAGLPVVAFDCVAGPSEMIRDGYNGFLVPLFNAEAFKLKLTRLMIDENLRNELGSNAKKSIVRFSRDKICDTFYAFITDSKN